MYVLFVHIGSCDDLIGAVVGVDCVVIIIMVITNIMIWIYCFSRRNYPSTYVRIHRVQLNLHMLDVNMLCKFTIYRLCCNNIIEYMCVHDGFHVLTPRDPIQLCNFDNYTPVHS